MSQNVTGRTKTFTASGALAIYRRVRLDSDLELAYCAADSTDCIGITDRPALAASDVIPVTLLHAQGTVILTASGSITAGNACYAAADGKVASSGTVLVGEALETTTTDGDQLEVAISPSSILGDVARDSLTQDDAEPYNVPLTDLRVTGTGALLGTSAGTPSGAFGLTVGTHGTASPKVVGEAASAASKTNKARFLFQLPPEYVDGQTVTLRVKARITGDVEVAQTLDATVYETDGAAGVGDDLCATAAKTLTSTFANCDFTITPTGLAAGDELDVELTGVANDTGGTANKLIEIGKIQMLLDIAG